MKRSELFFSVLLIPLDAVMVLSAFLFAYFLRTQNEVIYILSLPEYLTFILTLLPIWILIYALEGLYSAESGRRGLDEFADIFLGTSLGALLFTAAIFVTDTRIGSRVILLYAYLLSLLFVIFGRSILNWIRRALYKYNVGVHRVIVIGANDLAYQIVREITVNTRLGYVYLGHIAIAEHTHSQTTPLGKCLGAFEDSERILDHYQPDELIIATTRIHDKEMLKLLALTNQKRIDLRLTPNIVGVHTTNFSYQTMAGIPIIEVLRTPLQGWGRVAKRIFDFIGSLFVLIFVSPIMLLTALAVKITSPGPIIYRNTRVGQDKQHFETYKFRTMRIEYCTGDSYGGKQALQYESQLIQKQNSRKGAVYKVANDPRLTPIGEFLRTTSLDEFPQFFNVFFGTMSLVGPRPHQPREVALYQPWQEKLFTIKPGITGLAQISGRSDLDFDDEARLDIGYIERWSFWQDLIILLRTPMSLLRSRTRKAA
ncbi:sugar transferase [Candidatus Berkelbacteria bacterium]|nr:sugar transferase [Candidatus Berkelbacteria bacterium]